MDITKNCRIISVCQQKDLKKWEILATYSEIFQNVWQFMFKHGTRQKNIIRHSPGISAYFGAMLETPEGNWYATIKYEVLQ